MANELPLPADLQHLLEKRAETDRRKQTRRKGGAAAPQAGSERRTGADRRKRARRQDAE